MVGMLQFVSNNSSVNKITFSDISGPGLSPKMLSSMFTAVTDNTRLNLTHLDLCMLPSLPPPSFLSFLLLPPPSSSFLLLPPPSSPFLTPSAYTIIPDGPINGLYQYFLVKQSSFHYLDLTGCFKDKGTKLIMTALTKNKKCTKDMKTLKWGETKLTEIRYVFFFFRWF
jgi:hypothetical protein